LLDIELFRKDLKKIIDSEKKRFKDPTNAEKVLEYDIKWREAKANLEELNRQQNEISNKIAEFKKNNDKQNIEKAVIKSKEIKDQRAEYERKKEEYHEKREEYRYIVGNILHNSVPLGETEDHNEIIRVIGDIPKFNYNLRSHVELITEIDGADTLKASELVGSRFYYL